MIIDNALDFSSNEKSLNILDYKINTDNLLKKADRKRPKYQWELPMP